MNLKPIKSTSNDYLVQPNVGKRWPYTGTQKCIVIEWKERAKFEIVIACNTTCWILAKFFHEYHEAWVIIIELCLCQQRFISLVGQQKVNGHMPDAGSRPTCIYLPDIFKWLTLLVINSCESIPASRSSELG